MSEIKVSIIVPAYNVEKYLGVCLGSLVGQTLQELEVLVVNDGSTDGTQAVIEDYEARYPGKVKGFFQQNEGPSKARNLALKHASGKYIGFVDSDDQAEPAMFEKMVALAEKEAADLVLCGETNVSEESNTPVSSQMPPVITATTSIFQTKGLLSNITSVLWNKLFRRQIIESHRFSFNEDIHYAEDALFVYPYLLYAQRVCSIREPLYRYTVKRAGSITGAMDERMLHEVTACEELTKFYISTGHFEEFQGDLLQICAGFWGRKFYNFHRYPGKKATYDRFVSEFYDFLSRYYSDWKQCLRAYGTNGSRRKYRINFYKTNRVLARCYIYAPSGLIRFLRNTKQALRSQPKE